MLTLATTRPPRRSVGVAIVLLLALILAGCGSDEPGEAQPRPQGTGFGEGVFSNIPLHPRSNPVGTLTEKDGVTTQSYGTDGATPREVLAFYEDNLGEGWQMTGAVEEIGPESYRGTWVSDAHELQVSATTASRLDDNPTAEQLKVQYSLTLTELTG